MTRTSSRRCVVRHGSQELPASEVFPGLRWRMLLQHLCQKWNRYLCEMLCRLPNHQHQYQHQRQLKEQKFRPPTRTPCQRRMRQWIDPMLQLESQCLLQSRLRQSVATSGALAGTLRRSRTAASWLASRCQMLGPGLSMSALTTTCSGTSRKSSTGTRAATTPRRLSTERSQA